MNQQERQVISDIFDKLKQVESQPRDPEAERFIADLVARQPYAPYAMAQAIFVQEEALKQYNERVRALEAQADGARPQQASGGFLSGLFGGGAEQPAREAPRTSVPQAGMGSAPQYGAQQVQQPGMFGGGGGSGGFLRGAMTTAAGVAGGALLFQGLKGMFGGGGEEASPASGFGDPAQLKEAAGEQNDADAGVSDAAYDDGDFGDDVGDTGDWT